VLADVLCAMNLAASVMVNGVCCYYQMNEENERRQEQETVIKNALRKELDVHRQKEMMLKRDTLVKAYNDAVSSQVQDERRRKLMNQKVNAVAGTNNNSSRYQPAECDRVEPIAMDANHLIVTASNSLSSTMTKSENLFLSDDESPELFVFPGQYFVNGDKSRRNSSLASKKIKTVSSILDDSLSEDGSSFEEICIE